VKLLYPYLHGNFPTTRWISQKVQASRPVIHLETVYSTHP